jgi:hypothetical protein
VASPGFPALLGSGVIRRDARRACRRRLRSSGVGVPMFTVLARIAMISNLQVIVRSGSKHILICDLLMLLIACKRRAGVIRACQCPSASQDGSSNPEATSDLQSLSGKDSLIVLYDTTKVQT